MIGLADVGDKAVLLDGAVAWIQSIDEDAARLLADGAVVFVEHVFSSGKALIRTNEGRYIALPGRLLRPVDAREH